MKCSRCGAVLSPVQENAYEVRYINKNNIKRVDCTECGFCAALNFTGTWFPIEDVLTVKDGVEKHGWINGETESDKEVHFSLSQIFYREFEPPDEERQEAIFDLPDPDDVIKILWHDSSAIGFYTMKPKGLLIETTMERYAMNTLDTAYVRSFHRGKGHGAGVIHDLIQDYPNQDIGFSKPISVAMLNVLKKFLSENEIYRKRFWELEGPGGEGNQKLIWFSFYQ